MNDMEPLGIVNHEFLGSEFDWVAVDRNGVVGYFASAGAGWIPESILSEAEPFWDSLSVILSLPKISEVLNRCSSPHHILDWLEVAARGVFAFDWNHGTKRYELVASPVSFLRLEDAGKLAFLARCTCLPCLFAEDFPPRGPA